MCEIKEYADKGEYDAVYTLSLLEESIDYVAPGESHDREAAIANMNYLGNQGYVPAQVRLGHINAYGWYGPQNLAIAYLWYALASAEGDLEASIRLDWIREKMTKEEIRNADELVFQWLSKAHAH